MIEIAEQRSQGDHLGPLVVQPLFLVVHQDSRLLVRRDFERVA